MAPDRSVTRISGGHLKGRSVKSKFGSGLRPTAEVVRGALFSIVGDITGTRVLDLYAGTGILGIEALSRGAESADFVEEHSGRCREVKASLREMGLDAQGRVHRAKVEAALRTLNGEYDLVFADPPYDVEPWPWLADEMQSRGLLTQSVLFVAEHRHRTVLAERYGSIRMTTSRRYGDTAISVYGMAAE